MSNKSIQNRINVKEFFKKATDKNYYNLFQPVIPKIDLTGKIAQVISAATEAVTVWLICQSELSALNKAMSFVLSLIAVVLVVSAIEIGGRKGLQVITRAIVWKRLVNVWYWILFTFIVGITGFLFWQSYGLSTKGISQSFEQSVKATVTLDDAKLISRHGLNLDKINEKYDNQVLAVKSAFKLEYDAKEKEYNTKIQGVDIAIEKHKSDKLRGVKWAQSHVNKQTKNKATLETEKATFLAALTTTHTTELKAIETARNGALNQEDQRHSKALETAENNLTENHNTDKSNANFWGNLLSGLVGLMILVAFVCIIIVEIFRKGAGIEIDYEETTIPPSLATIAAMGVNNRLFNVAYKWVFKLYVDKKNFEDKFDHVHKLRNEDSTQLNNQWNSIISEDIKGRSNQFNDLFLNRTSENSTPTYSKFISPTIHSNDHVKDDNERIIVRGFLPPDSINKEVDSSYNDLVNELFLDQNDTEGNTTCDRNGCNNRFNKKNHRHRFCSTDCRIHEWETKAGTKLRKKKGT